MKNTVTDNHPTIENVGQQFQTYRSTRSIRKSIPQHLWRRQLRFAGSIHLTPETRNTRVNTPLPLLPVSTILQAFNAARIHCHIPYLTVEAMLYPQGTGSASRTSSPLESKPHSDSKRSKALGLKQTSWVKSP